MFSAFEHFMNGKGAILIPIIIIIMVWEKKDYQVFTHETEKFSSQC